MARYIDADALLESMPDDLPYKGSVKRVLMQAHSADVAPKSEVDYWMDTTANARREILLEIERLALSKIPEDVEVTMLKDTYYIEALEELMIKYGVTEGGKHYGQQADQSVGSDVRGYI